MNTLRRGGYIQGGLVSELVSIIMVAGLTSLHLAGHGVQSSDIYIPK